MTAFLKRVIYLEMHDQRHDYMIGQVTYSKSTCAMDDNTELPIRSPWPGSLNDLYVEKASSRHERMISENWSKCSMMSEYRELFVRQ